MGDIPNRVMVMVNFLVMKTPYVYNAIVVGPNPECFEGDFDLSFNDEILNPIRRS